MEVSPELQAKLDQIAKLPKHIRMVIMAGIAALVVAGYYTGCYEASKEQLAGLQVRELELQRKLSEVRSVAANIDSFEEEIAELQVKLNRALRQLPNKKELEVLLTDISNLGKTSGVEIKSFRRKNEVIYDFYAEVPIDIKLEGGYHDIARFFDLLSRLPRIVNMGSLSIQIAKESAEGTLLKVSGVATTFRFVGNEA